MRLQLLWLEAPPLGLVASLPSQRHPKLQGLLIVPDIQLTCRGKIGVDAASSRSRGQSVEVREQRQGVPKKPLLQNYNWNRGWITKRAVRPQGAPTRFLQTS